MSGGVKMVVLTTTLLCHLIQVVHSDCDLSGLCIELQNMYHSSTLLCNADEDCIHPTLPDCFKSKELPNAFSCDPSDCVVIQSMATNKQGCLENFPNIKNTVMEVHSETPLSDEFPADSLGKKEPSKDQPIMKDGQLIFHSSLRK
jgi:hypothetical protein